MKSTDKKTLILLGILLAIAAIVIIVSQNFEEQKNRFGVTTEPETNSTVITTVETTEKITEKETRKTGNFKSQSHSNQTK